MTSGPQTIIIPVRDLAAAKAVYADLLGVEPDMDEPYYVAYTEAGHHIVLDPHGHAKGMTGPTTYWHVDDIHDTVNRLVAAGARQGQAVHDVGGGRLVGSVLDADGNSIGLIQATSPVARSGMIGACVLPPPASRPSSS